jgi:hypothetical protein
LQCNLPDIIVTAWEKFKFNSCTYEVTTGLTTWFAEVPDKHYIYKQSLPCQGKIVEEIAMKRLKQFELIRSSESLSMT